MTGKKYTDVQERLNSRYRVLEIDLSEARGQPEKQEIRDFIYNELTVLQSPTAFNIILNDEENDTIPVAANQTLSIYLFHIKEVFITNTAGQGTAYIWLAARRPIEEGLDR